MFLMAFAGNELICHRCELTMGKVPDKTYHYSDHEGVTAELTLKRNVTGTCSYAYSCVISSMYSFIGCIRFYMGVSI